MWHENIKTKEGGSEGIPIRFFVDLSGNKAAKARNDTSHSESIGMADVNIEWNPVKGKPV